MSTHKKIDVICIAAVLFSVALTVLLISGRTLGIIPTVNAAAGSAFFTSDDLNADWASSSATKIVLSDKGSTVSGNGAYVYNGNVYIIYAGCYVLTGELTNGSVVVDAEKTDKVWISLNGVSLHCDDDAAIRVEQADKVFLTLAEGTENTVSSGADYNTDVTASGVDGTIYSRDDLTINGTGTLVVNAEYKHGIVCNDDLRITGGNITVTAVQDGIHANDSVCIQDAVISVSAGDDGITVSNDDETAFLYIASGTISIPACYEGLEAIDITIAGGTIDIRPTDDGINANGSGRNSVIRITGGDITVINPSGRDADGLDSNGSIYIEGGRVFISVTATGGNCALDYGSENGGECVVSGGTVIACGGSTMAEGFDTDSPQGFLMYSTSGAAGAAISLKDSNGHELFSAEIPCSFSSVVISTPELNSGDVCTLDIDGVQNQITIGASSSGSNPGGMFGGGKSGGGRPSDRWESGYTDETPQDMFPKGEFPQDMLPQDEFPQDMFPQDEFPQDMFPQDEFPQDEFPQDMFPQDEFPQDEFPQDMFPQDEFPQDGFPQGMFPQDEFPQDNTQNMPQQNNGRDFGNRQDMNFPDSRDTSDQENRAGGRDIQEAGGRALTPDTENMPQTNVHSLQQGRTITVPAETASPSTVSSGTFALISISVLALLIGLLIAVKMKH